MEQLIKKYLEICFKIELYAEWTPFNSKSQTIIPSYYFNEEEIYERNLTKFFELLFSSKYSDLFKEFLQLKKEEEYNKVLRFLDSIEITLGNYNYIYNIDGKQYTIDNMDKLWGKYNKDNPNNINRFVFNLIFSKWWEERVLILSEKFW